MDKASNPAARTWPVAIAPAQRDQKAEESPKRRTMPYTCQTCAKRKVRCDKFAPVCSTCRKSNLDCLYQAPVPRRRHRNLEPELLNRLACYERIIQEHGLLDEVKHAADHSRHARQGTISLLWNEPPASGTGMLLTGQRESIYVDSNLWRSFEVDGNQCNFLDESEEEEDGEDKERDHASVEGFGLDMSDPLTDCFIGSHDSVIQLHPTQSQAMTLWKAHVDNVEPLCKILHIPSVTLMVELVSQQPETASKGNECLLFAIFHFAAISMTDEECVAKMGETRIELIQRYHFAARNALVRASFLKTTEMPILQALVLFLMASRHSYDAHTYWILTGVAVRIAQRMGLHRDGDKLGLPPFEVQMRRRMFYQLLPLDGGASQRAGTLGAMMPTDSWDTQHPLNLNDEQIWPGMTQIPAPQVGATDMIYCLSRACIGQLFVRAKDLSKGGSHFSSQAEAEAMIEQVEGELEDRFVRYCDIVKPLHFLTVALGRAGIAAARLRMRLSNARSKPASDEEVRETMQLAHKILDTDAAVCGNAGLHKFRWQNGALSLWGTWESLLFVLTTLDRRRGMLSTMEADESWNRVQQIYQDHGSLIESEGRLGVAFGRLTLRVWHATHASSGVFEPSFITALRDWRRRRTQDEPKSLDDVPQMVASKRIYDESLVNSSLGQDDPANTVMDGFFGELSAAAESSSNFEEENWVSWYGLIQEYQAQDIR